MLSPRRPHRLGELEHHIVIKPGSLQAPAPATSERSGGTAKNLTPLGCPYEDETLDQPVHNHVCLMTHVHA